MITWFNRDTLSKYINLGEGLFCVSLITQSSLSAGLIGCYWLQCHHGLAISLSVVVGSVMLSSFYSMLAMFLSHSVTVPQKTFLPKGIAKLLALTSSSFWIGAFLLAYKLGHIEASLIPFHYLFALIHYAALCIIIKVTYK